MNNISSLLERFLKSRKSNTTPYFEEDELVSLIDYFLDKDDAPNLKAVIELGYKLYPDSVGFGISLCKTLVAIEDYKSALKLADDIGIKGNKDIDLIRLECYCELDRRDEAIGLIDELTALDSPYLEDAVYHTACVMNDMEKYYQDTCTFIQHALTMFPDNLSLKSELCFNLELQGKTKEALTLCHELLDEDPYSAEIWYMQGRLYSLCADFERAVDSLDFALTCINETEDSDLEYEIKLMKAYCLYKNESYQKAIAIYEELTSYEDFDNSEVELFLAECFMNMEEYEKAYHILKPVIGNNDLEDEVSVYGNFIYCCIETERRKEAIEVLSEALRLFPNRILEYLSTLNMTRDQLTEAYADESIIGELARKYLNSNLHNN
ncbi:MAG: tetratricopeptide repeat protein [Tannerella sp.]|jgi:tetratricopeptide (TPR) repeat protein|nr:tetratricopeptide repeat protein [Tannerella sp.]